MTPVQPSINNGLIAALSAEGFARLAPHMTPIDLPYEHSLIEPHQPNETVCFLVSGLASVVASNQEESVEIAHIGREGMSGEHIALACEQTSNRTFMQVAGAGWTMPVARMNEAFDADPNIRTLFQHYSQTCVIQIAQTALANARYSVRERLARWLLMVHDRLDGDNLPLTHDLLGLMLGVRRSGITDQIHLLEGDRAIRATRGSIRILSRPILLEAAGASYGNPEREYERLIGCPIDRERR